MHSGFHPAGSATVNIKTTSGTVYLDYIVGRYRECAGQDADGDGVCDVWDVYPGVDDILADPDRDGRYGTADNCPDTFNASQDNGDGDLDGDACDPCFLESFVTGPDTDGDRVCAIDNCPTVRNPRQEDEDRDSQEDRSDNGLDNDTISNACDHCI